VLRKGGRIMILEFSHVRNPVLSQIYEQYSFNVIPKIGGLVAGDSASYQVLLTFHVSCEAARIAVRFIVDVV
jgi:ubiquinone/menaquinone biosynthesis C-methylase UbiE